MTPVAAEAPLRIVATGIVDSRPMPITAVTTSTNRIGTIASGDASPAVFAA